MKTKTRAEWADLIVGVTVVGLCLGFYLFTYATHLNSKADSRVVKAGFQSGIRGAR